MPEYGTFELGYIGSWWNDVVLISNIAVVFSQAKKSDDNIASLTRGQVVLPATCRDRNQDWSQKQVYFWAFPR